jgi:hypothetical protein
MLGKYRTDLLLLLHNLPLLKTLHIGINVLHGDAPSILFPTSLPGGHFQPSEPSAFLYTGLFTRRVLLNFYFAAINNTMGVTTKSNVLFLLN